MDFLLLFLTIIGLAFFEIVSSIDNAIINAEVLSTVGQKVRKWFLLWGLIIAVFVVRGILPFIIVWLTTPSLGPTGVLTATFSSDPRVLKSIEESSPILLVGGGTFLLFLFLNWLFLEQKAYGLPGERFVHRQGVWFFAISSALLALIVWLGLKINPLMAFAAVLGSTVYFITHGFKQNAEIVEETLLNKKQSDISKILYLEVIDATFSLDGVLGAFAFTLAVPAILLGNGLGAIVLRNLTIGNINSIRKYVFLKNGAMYSVFFLSCIMLLRGFGILVPEWLSPIITFASVAYFFYKSKLEIRKNG